MSDCHFDRGFHLEFAWVSSPCLILGRRRTPVGLFTLWLAGLAHVGVVRYSFFCEERVLLAESLCHRGLDWDSLLENVFWGDWGLHPWRHRHLRFLGLRPLSPNSSNGPESRNHGSSSEVGLTRLLPQNDWVLHGVPSLLEGALDKMFAGRRFFH